jgi:hypothetical protein
VLGLTITEICSSSVSRTVPRPTFTRSLWKDYVAALSDSYLTLDCEDDTTSRSDDVEHGTDHSDTHRVPNAANLRLRAVAACVQTVSLTSSPADDSRSYR